MFVPEKEFKEIVKYTPLVNIDFIIKNDKGQYLLGYRNNSPAKDFWFVPGGRLRKGETIKKAFFRISHEEVGRVFWINESEFLGVFEHLYDENTFNDLNFGTHYIVLAYRINFSISFSNLPKDQHATFKWFAKEEILCREDVHENTKVYFV